MNPATPAAINPTAVTAYPRAFDPLAGLLNCGGMAPGEGLRFFFFFLRLAMIAAAAAAAAAIPPPINAPVGIPPPASPE